MANRMTNTPLWRIAERIARNREVLGMHYPSDSEAGLRLAAQALPILLACPLIGAAGHRRDRPRQGGMGLTMQRGGA